MMKPGMVLPPRDVFDCVDQFKFVVVNDEPQLRITWKKMELTGNSGGEDFYYRLDKLESRLIKGLKKAFNNMIYDIAIKEGCIETFNELAPVALTKSTMQDYHQRLCNCEKTPCENKDYYINRLLYVLETTRKSICDVEKKGNKLLFK